MGLRYDIDESRNLITITGEYADAAEWERLLAEFAADPRRRPGCVILRDQRGGTRPVDVPTVLAIMEVVRRFWPILGARRAAIVMPRLFDSPGLVAQAIAGEDDIPIQAFATYDAALDWLTT